MFRWARDKFKRLRPSPDSDPFAPESKTPFAEPMQPSHSPQFEDGFRSAIAHPPLPDDWDREPASKAVVPTQGAAEPTPALLLIQPQPTSVPTPVAAAATAGDELLAAFLRGIALPDARPAGPAAAMEAVGAAFRALVSGLRMTMIARSAIKGEFRIEQTMIRSRGNNPLKFSADDDDALLALLGTGRRTEMGAAEAVADALRDIRLHEVATIAAIHSSVSALFARFEPSKLRLAAHHGRLKLLPVQRKAQAWDAFEAIYAQTRQGRIEDFDGFFGKAFAQAYSQALTEASAKDPSPPPTPFAPPAPLNEDPLVRRQRQDRAAQERLQATLTLTMIRCPDTVPPQTRTVAGVEFSIGSGSESDWVLPDPDRCLSKRHCLLAYRSGGWQVTDLSANGTFLNGEAEPVGRGQPRDLRDGDRLRLGAYEIELRIMAEPAMVWRSPAGRGDPFALDPFAPRAAPEIGLLDQDPLLRRGMEQDPFAQALVPPSINLPPDYDPLTPEPGGAPFAGPTQPDHSPHLEDAFRLALPHSLLPDDWDHEPAPQPPAAARVATVPPRRRF
jgi:predicted component of type VI protein secretion system